MYDATGSSERETRKSHLLHLVKETARAYKSSSKKPIDDALFYLKCFDFDALRVFKSLKRMHVSSNKEFTYSGKLELPRICATFRTAARPAVILIPGHHVQLASGELCMFLGALRMNHEEIFAYVLKLDPYIKDFKKSTNRKAKKKKQTLSDVVHPVAKLRLYQRRHVDDIELIPVRDFYIKVRVVPAFHVEDNMDISINGYLLSHGMYNFDFRGKNEQPASS